MSRLRSRPSRPAILVVSVALVMATAAAAQAQEQAQSTPITSPTTSAAPVTSPPTTSFLGLFPGTTAPGSTPVTNERPTKIVPTTTAPSTTAPAAGAGGDGEPPPGTSKVVPPDAQRQIDSVRRTGPNNTTAWLAALQPLVTELGMTPQDAALAGAGRFPIAGPTTWVDDWLFPRYVPSFHLHKGLDMFAASGTPVRAPFDGTLRLSNGAVGGLAAYVTMSDGTGTYVYLAHMSAYASDKSSGQQVRQGDVVGFVGDTGNARGGAPHVHLQLHPKGGEPAPPKPTIDAWLAEATAGAPQVVAALRAARNPPAATEAGASVTGLEAPGVDETAPTVDPAAALWAASSNPAIGTIDLASSLVATAADEIDWPTPPG